VGFHLWIFHNNPLCRSPSWTGLKRRRNTMGKKYAVLCLLLKKRPRSKTSINPNSWNTSASLRT
jgi:hypothetical protein